MTYSIIIPVYKKNAESIPRLIQALREINESLNNEVEAVFLSSMAARMHRLS